jgi:hypothetical protein
MCSQIPTNATDYLNLQRNPERWTGYVHGWCGSRVVDPEMNILTVT